MCRIIDQNIKKCVFDNLEFQKFLGEHAPGPPRKATASPSQWSLLDHSLIIYKSHHISSVPTSTFQKLASMEWFFTFPCRKVAPLPSVLNGTEFTLSVAKNVALVEAVRIFCFASVKWRDSLWLTGDRSNKQKIEFPAAPSFFSLKKWIKLIPKTIGNRKRDCAWGCARGINTTRENLHIEKHKSGRRSFHSPEWFVLFDLQIFSGSVYPPSATSRTISFSISNSFWY